MTEMEELVKDLKKDCSYIIYKRTLPPLSDKYPVGINKIVAQNLESYEAAREFCKTMKLVTKERVDDDGNRQVVYYDILPDAVRLQDVYYNENKITTVGNDRKKVARTYLDLED